MSKISETTSTISKILLCSFYVISFNILLPPTRAHPEVGVGAAGLQPPQTPKNEISRIQTL
jgi:hypothetical protein